MKVLHLTNNYPTHRNPIFGIFVKEQIDSLNSYVDTNEVFFINGREKGKLEYFNAIRKLKAFLRNNNYDLIHCHHALSALVLILTGIKKQKFIVSFQNDPNKELGRYVYSFINKRTNGIIFKNDSELVESNSRFHYLPNGVNLDFFKPLDKNESKQKLGLEKHKRYVLFVSSNFVRKQKRYDKFTKVLNLLRNRYGFENIEELKMINIDRKLIPLYFNSVDLHLLTSDFEGSPNSVKEALSCNIPVVSTNVGNVSSMINDTEGCFVSHNNSVENLAFLANKALKIEESKGRERIVELELDKDSVAKKLIKVYQSVVIKKYE